MPDANALLKSGIAFRQTYKSTFERAYLLRQPVVR